MTLNERVSELMRTKMRDAPPLAIEYYKHLAGKYGGCGKVFVTAFAHYAQAVEGLSTNDSLYQIDDEGKQWFAAAEMKEINAVKA